MRVNLNKYNSIYKKTLKFGHWSWQSCTPHNESWSKLLAVISIDFHLNCES